MTDLPAPLRPVEDVVRCPPQAWQAWLARWMRRCVRRLEQHPPPTGGPYLC